MFTNFQIDRIIIEDKDAKPEVFNELPVTLKNCNSLIVELFLQGSELSPQKLAAFGER